MTTFSTVDAEAFREAVRPVVDAIGALTEAVDAVAPRFGRRPHVDAPAMRELSDEQDYAGRSGMDAPITLTHSLGGLTLTAATDYGLIRGTVHDRADAALRPSGGGSSGARIGNRLLVAERARYRSRRPREAWAERVHLLGRRASDS